MGSANRKVLRCVCFNYELYFVVLLPRLDKIRAHDKMCGNDVRTG